MVRFIYYLGTDTDQKIRARHYRFDNDDDIPNLPKNGEGKPLIITGSEAYNVDTGDVYMFSEKINDWKLQ